MLNTVLTVYEISSGEQFEGSHFENMDETVLRRAIALLEEEVRAPRKTRAAVLWMRFSDLPGDPRERPPSSKGTPPLRMA